MVTKFAEEIQVFSVTLWLLVNIHQCFGGACGSFVQGLSSQRRDHVTEDLNNQNVCENLIPVNLSLLIVKMECQNSWHVLTLKRRRRWEAVVWLG